MRWQPVAHCEQLEELELEGREGIKRRERDFMLMKLGAIVSGLVAGGFLFFQYSRLLTHNFGR